MYSAIGTQTLDILFYKKEIEIKTLFGHIDQEQKCSVFTFVEYIIPVFIKS